MTCNIPEKRCSTASITLDNMQDKMIAWNSIVQVIKIQLRYHPDNLVPASRKIITISFSKQDKVQAPVDIPKSQK